LYPYTERGKIACVLCSNPFEEPDTAFCPAYGAPICALCCSLDARCDDLCKPHARLSAQWDNFVRWAFPEVSLPCLHTRLAHYLGVLGLVIGLLSLALWLIYSQVSPSVVASPQEAGETLYQAFLKAFL
ncbi:hypothetical protein OEZ78_28325, partial [Leclercia adecarboxylata]|uniref:hypothetical protein n=1 Tax=Leclercia adecarboxylata TaxID=83655 RepID=UPI00234E1712